LSANHDLQAKALFDEFLSRARSNTLADHQGSESLVLTRSSKTFPSPDAVFFDEKRNWMTSCEFKPETETKRGILTGFGQCVSYLAEANLAYLAIPRIIEDFQMADFMRDMFTNQVVGRLPIGLIVFPNSEPTKFDISVPIDESVINKNVTAPSAIAERPWAKIQDLPLEILLQLLRHFLKNESTGKLANDIFAEFWKQDILENGSQVSSLTIPSTFRFKYHYGTEFKPLTKKKNSLSKLVKENKKTLKEALTELQKDTDPYASGDNYAVSYRKNWLTALYHLDLVTPSGQLLDDGLKLYKVGAKFGGSSRPMVDEFTKIVLTNGKHLPLLLDLEDFQADHGADYHSLKDLTNGFVNLYDEQGKIKWNRNRRQQEGQNEQLKYEKILWNKLDLALPSKGISVRFNWKRITSLLAD